MAIAFVGSNTATNSGVVSLPGGLAENDLVFVLTCSDGSLAGATIAGWTRLYQAASTAPENYIFYKFMGAVPDTSVTVPNYDAGNDEAVIVYAFRGVDTSSPFDIASPFYTEAAGGTGDPDCPSITTTTDSAVVMACGFLDDDSATVTNLSGYNDTVFVAAGTTTGSPSTAMVAWKTISPAGAENPPAYVTTGDDAWIAISIALRPVVEGAGAASASGVATGVMQGSPIHGAAMSSGGAATANAVGQTVSLADGVMSAVAAATATAEGASLADGVMSANGSASAIVVGEGGIVIVVPDFTPVGGGGAIPPVRDRDKRFRIRKDKTRPHVIRVGDWPTEAQMAEMADALARAERQDFARFISGIQEPEPVEDYDEDERALMFILAAA